MESTRERAGVTAIVDGDDATDVVAVVDRDAVAVEVTAEQVSVGSPGAWVVWCSNNSLHRCPWSTGYDCGVAEESPLVEVVID